MSDRRFSRPASTALALLSCLAAAACAAGPDFKKPAPPAVTRYTESPVTTTVATPGVAGGEAQRLSEGGQIAQDWWTLFHSAALNALVEQSLRNNPDLKAAQAALNQRVADSKAVSMEAISRARMAALAARDGVVTTAERGSAAAQAGSAWTGNKIGEGVDAAQLGSARIAFDAQAGTAHKVASIGGYLMELGKKWKPEGNRP